MYANIVNLDITNSITEFIKYHSLYPYIRLYGYSELSSVNTKLPTLYIGYRMNKKRIPDLKIEDTFISETERWAFTPEESSIFFIEQCTSFLEEIPAMLIHALKPISLEPIFSVGTTFKHVEKVLLDYKPRVCYFYNNIISLSNGHNDVIIINTLLWKAFGSEPKAFFSLFNNQYSENKPRILMDDMAKIRVFFMEVFDYKPELITFYAPYLINLKDQFVK